MKSALIFLAVVVLSVAIFTTMQSRRGGERTPFYLTNIEAMRALPEEDLLRMRDDIFAKSAALPDTEFREELQAGSKPLLTGTLAGATPERPASGRISVVQLSDGTPAARLEDFRVPSAPDLRLILEGESTVDAGPLRGNTGSQNFPLPPDWKPGTSPRAVIRSVLFQADFARAPLQREP